MGRARAGSRREAGSSERGTPVFRNAVQPWHLLVVLVVCLLVFGSKKLPDMARSLGRSMRILKSEARALRADDTP